MFVIPQLNSTMPRNTKDVPIREKHTRIAKDKATLQIVSFFALDSY